jgi:hypothetical protein
MSAWLLESFLARVYVDDVARAQFLADPRGEATRAGLQTDEIEHLVNIDREGLEMFAHSLHHKKAQKIQKAQAKHEHHKNHHR